MGLTITGGINLTGNVTTSALFAPGQATLTSRIATYTGTANQANVAFTPPSSAGSLSITSHSAISTPGNIVGTVAQASAGNITVTGLSQGTTYTFKVFATSGVGNGAQSSDSTFPFIAGNVPETPTAPTASQGSSFLTAGKGTAIVTFTAPSNNGIPISSHTAQSSPDNIVSSVYQASSGDILVDGLTPGTAYTFTVFATNDAGSSASSPASGSVTPQVGQQVEYTTPGTYTWVAPAGLTTVSVVTVGGGATGSYYSQTNPGGGGGGGLGYANVSVTGGNSYTVVAANSGGQSYFSSNAVVAGNGGSTAWATVGPGGGFVGNGGGSGGFGGAGGGAGSSSGGGGGAGGYSGNGGNGSNVGSGSNGANGAGGAGGGGGYGAFYGGSGGGGGVGIYGAGPNGVGGDGASHAGGGGGSNGTNGGSAYGWRNFYAGPGGLYGGGGGSTLPNNYNETPGTGGKGAVRIIWGTGRHYPSTNTANVFYSSANYPGTPTIGTVSVPLSDFVVSYTAGPAGSFPIVSHTAISTPGNITATANQASSGSITYSNSSLLFTVGTSYTFKVFATNLAGSGPQSSASASYTWTYGGQQAEYTVPGTYTWIAPTGVSSVSTVAIGGGGSGSTSPTSSTSGGGGGLGYANVSVIAGNSYTVVAGTGSASSGTAAVPGGQSYFSANTVVAGNGGGGTGAGGGYVGNGGGFGGNGASQAAHSGAGGGGAGGYSGNGGNGGANHTGGANGAGGGGGGGGMAPNSTWHGGGGGGGVGIYGAGPNGTGAASGTVNGGGGGSSGIGGSPSGPAGNQPGNPTTSGGAGGLYGGGGGAGVFNTAGTTVGGGGNGAVRIIWGSGRNYPSTNTANVAYGAPDIPGTPTSATAILSGGSIAINYVAGPAGSIPTSSHAAVSTPGNLIASVNQANSGGIQYGNVFTPGVTYSFNVYALNAAGRSPVRTTNSLFYQGVGYQTAYIVPGSYTWIAPTGVSNVSVVAVGGGGTGAVTASPNTGAGGGGGGLGYANVTVTGGSPYTVVVGLGGVRNSGWGGTSGEQSYFSANTVVAGNGGAAGGAGGGHVGNGGGNGGHGAFSNSSPGNEGGGGGGAGGYSGNGGQGGNGNTLSNGANGSGGGGGGGAYGSAWAGGGGGGGVGIYGSGPNGAGGTGAGGGGGGGSTSGVSGGTNGSVGGGQVGGAGGIYGGGGGGLRHNSPSGTVCGDGGNGAVRIIWVSPTYTTRRFPSSNTQDVFR